MTAAPDTVLDQCDIAIIGGGLAGASLAYFLGREGADVCLVEKGGLFSEGTGANAGSIHEQVFTSVGPENRTSVDRQASVIPIFHQGAKLWEELGREWGVDLGLKKTGGLLIAEADADLDRLRYKVLAENRAGGETRLIERDELRDRAPYITPLATHAVFSPNEGKINILAGLTALEAQLSGTPVRQYLQTEVIGISDHGTGKCIHTPRGVLKCKRLVLAGGAWNQVLANMLGWRFPLRARAIQCLATEAAPPIVFHTIQHATRRMTLKQNHHGTIVIGGGWPAKIVAPNVPPVATASSVLGCLAAASHVVPAVGHLTALRAWASYISTPIDDMPAVGGIPGCDNCYVIGTNTFGITTGHALAKGLAALLLAGEEADFLTHTSPKRQSLQE